VLDLSRHYLNEEFGSCELAGHITNSYSVKNEETRDHPDLAGWESSVDVFYPERKIEPAN
jgi:hypothetical protein